MKEEKIKHKSKIKVYQCRVCYDFFLKGQVHRHLLKHKFPQLEKILDRFEVQTFKEVKKK